MASQLSVLAVSATNPLVGRTSSNKRSRSKLVLRQNLTRSVKRAGFRQIVSVEALVSGAPTVGKIVTVRALDFSRVH